MPLRMLACFVLLFALAACDKPRQQSPSTPASETGTATVTVQAGGNIWRNAPYEPTFVEMRLVKVGDHTYYAQGTPGSATEHDGFISNAGAVITSEGVVLFDALGTPSLGFLLLSKIRELTDQPVRKIITSHYHADHIYGMQVFTDFAAWSGVEIWAPQGAKEYIDSEESRNRLEERRESLFPWVDENTRLVKPTHYVSAEERFTLGGIDFTIIPLGSTHSQGDLMLRVESEGVLFSGDLIFLERIPFVEGDTAVWLRQLRRLDTRNVRVIVPGHGPALRDAAQAVAFTEGYLSYMHEQMGAAVENLVPFAEAYAATDWSRYESLPAFVANRPNAYRIYLQLEQSSFGE